jgi:hypothetical protein
MRVQVWGFAYAKFQKHNRFRGCVSAPAGEPQQDVADWMCAPRSDQTPKAIAIKRQLLNPLHGNTSGKPEVNMIQAWSFAQQTPEANPQRDCATPSSKAPPCGGKYNPMIEWSTNYTNEAVPKLKSWNSLKESGNPEVPSQPIGQTPVCDCSRPTRSTVCFAPPAVPAHPFFAVFLGAHTRSCRHICQPQRENAEFLVVF